MTPTIASLERARSIEGWMNDRELAWLAGAAARARVVIEVGSHKGRSTRALADHCPGIVYAVDPWEDGAVYRAFRANLGDHIFTGRVIPCAAPFESIADALPEADLIFVDDDHDYALLVRHIALARGLAKKTEGVVAGHDYAQRKFPGVKRAVDEAFPAGVSRCSTIWWVTP